MNKAKNMVNILGFTLLLPFAGIVYFIIDNYRGLKQKKENRKGFTPTFHTRLPDQPAKDFNSWSEHIYKLNQNRK